MANSPYYNGNGNAPNYTHEPYMDYNTAMAPSMGTRPSYRTPMTTNHAYNLPQLTESRLPPMESISQATRRQARQTRREHQQREVASRPIPLRRSERLKNRGMATLPADFEQLRGPPASAYAAAAAVAAPSSRGPTIKQKAEVKTPAPASRHARHTTITTTTIAAAGHPSRGPAIKQEAEVKTPAPAPRHARGRALIKQEAGIYIKQEAVDHTPAPTPRYARSTDSSGATSTTTTITASTTSTTSTATSATPPVRRGLWIGNCRVRFVHRCKTDPECQAKCAAIRAAQSARRVSLHLIHRCWTRKECLGKSVALERALQED
jgi:hypothetical protein